VLLDRRQNRWALVTVIVGVLSVGLYLWLNHGSPNGLTGGSTAGLWYGVAGSALMIYAGLLSAHRLFPAAWWMGPRKTWLRGQILPGWLARRFPDEAPYGQISHLCQLYREEADDLVDKVAPATVAAAVPPSASLPTYRGPTFALELRTFHDTEIRPFLVAPAPRRSPLMSEQWTETRVSALRRRLGLRGGSASDEASAALDRLEELVGDRRRLAEQEKMWRWLHGWLLLHVPLSAALLVLGIVHVLMSLYY
jgi:hypothetical protein